MLYWIGIVGSGEPSQVGQAVPDARKVGRWYLVRYSLTYARKVDRWYLVRHSLTYASPIECS